ncbi:MAG: DUF2279 domain-containing protein [Bacteroidia bacterium]
MNLCVSFVNLRVTSFSLILVFFTQFSFSQSDSLGKAYKRKAIIGTALGTAYVGSMAGLYQLWYADYPQSKFHFFNDNKEWLHMDKVGHVFSAYTLGKYGIDMFKWAGYSKRQAAIAGPLYGYLYQTTIEVFDGFSSEWGFSGGDVLSNTLGAGLVMGQELLWNEQRITMKFSFAPTQFSKVRPEILGGTLAENLFKDYNGQTYWLCISPREFAPKSKWPAWLDISLGYGATGMYGGEDNIWFSGGIGQFHDYSSTARRMQFYLSPDINLEKLKVKKKWIKYSFKILNTFKFPLPTLNFTQGIGFKLEPFKF